MGNHKDRYTIIATARSLFVSILSYLESVFVNTFQAVDPYSD